MPESDPFPNKLNRSNSFAVPRPKPALSNSSPTENSKAFQGTQSQCVHRSILCHYPKDLHFLWQATQEMWRQAPDKRSGTSTQNPYHQTNSNSNGVSVHPHQADSHHLHNEDSLPPSPHPQQVPHLRSHPRANIGKQQESHATFPDFIPTPTLIHLLTTFF